MKQHLPSAVDKKMVSYISELVPGTVKAFMNTVSTETREK